MRQLCTNSGCITLSYIHLLYVKKMTNMNEMVLIPSREVEIGDSLIVSSGHYENSFNDSKVIKIMNILIDIQEQLLLHLGML